MVALPPSYDSDGSKQERYDVLYVLDGNDLWPIAVSAHRLRLASFGANPSRKRKGIIIVGIGYDAKTYWETMPGRAADFTPTPGPEDSLLIRPFGGRRRTGEAAKFLRVLHDEIIPAIETRFRTTDDRGIVGHSLGAGFVAYTLFERPETFRRYAMLSPNYYRDDNYLFKREAEFAKRRNDLPKYVFVARGSAENERILNSTREMLDSLRHRNYTGLELQEATFERETHFSVIPAALARAFEGLRYF